MKIILGPPGTGKTTRLLGLVEQYMEAGVPPDRVGYFAFTRRAAQEAVDRAMERFCIGRSQLPYFRTLHSLAFAALGISKSQMMAMHHYREVQEWLKIPFFLKQQSADGPFVDIGYEDKFLELVHLSRITGVPLDRLYARSEVRHKTDWWKVDHVAKGLRHFKDTMELFDYTDLIEQFVHRDLAPRLEVLFIDEAQDLSPLQWQMVRTLEASAGETYVAGDDDQAIYRWAGADVRQFINLEGEVEVLGRSHRIPALHHEVSQKLLQRIRDRRPKEFLPRDERGVIARHRHSEEVDISEGEWLLLARTRRLADQLEEEVRQRGHLYTKLGGSTMDMKVVHAVQMWERLRSGERIRISDARQVYEYMGRDGVAHGHKALKGVDDDTLVSLSDLQTYHGLLHAQPWDVGLARIPESERRYLKACLRKGEDLQAKPRITVSTIHGSKGTEAEKVLLMTDESSRTASKWRKTPHDQEDEERVWYVGLTRAKNELHLINPQYTRGFNVPY